jgi:predicted secreted Zn-dependent protease
MKSLVVVKPMRALGLALTLCLANVVYAGMAEAKPSAATKYKFYTITGDTPAEIYAAMIKRGPDVNGVNAYASTLATSSQSGRLMQGKTCKVQDYHFKIDFVINLPKLRSEAALTGPTKVKWAEFKAFLKSHEETHRSIWLGCAQALEQKMATLRTKDCKAMDKQAAKMWKGARSSCDEKHRAWDKAEQKRLLVHPFVQLVLGNQLRTLVALKAIKKRK